MKYGIHQLLPSEQSTRLDPWQVNAMRDPRVRNHGQLTDFWEAKKIPDQDYNTAYYMDDSDQGLLCCSLDKSRKTTGLGLWVLNNNSLVAGKFIKFILEDLPKLHPTTYYAYCISAANKLWLQAHMKHMTGFLWGVEPKACYDVTTDSWVDLYHFKVKISDLGAVRRAHKLSDRPEQRT